MNIITIEEMPDEYIIKEFIVANRAEVKNMFLTEYNEQKVLEKARMEGVKEGIEKGVDQERGVRFIWNSSKVIG